MTPAFRHLLRIAILFLCLSWTARNAAATTYEVGPGKPYAALQNVAPLLNPGDLVLVYGGATYPGGVILNRAGTAANPITVRGVRVGGVRPILSGGFNTIELQANHYIFEGFEVTAGSFRGIYHHAHDITVRDCLVRDCPAHGLLGADSDSGSLLLDYCEFRNCGNGTTQHQVYMATDNTVYPNAVFRMQFCWVHDANGGNNVKSRAGRNEIYYNWIEGAQYHELELIGADGQVPSLVREDSDVVGNVLRKVDSQGTFITRIGGDGTGTSDGRYRFAYNTILLAPSTTASVFRLFETLESFEAHHNVIYRLGGGPVSMTSTSGLTIPLSSVAIVGTKNWIPSGSTNVPAAWTGTIAGAAPGFVSSTAPLNLVPAAGSPLLDASAASMPSPSGFPFPNPLPLPLFSPQLQSVPVVGYAKARAIAGILDLGALERAGATPLGSGEDLLLSTSTNAQLDPAAALKVALGPSSLGVQLSSPAGTFVGAAPLLAAQLFPTFLPPPAVPGFPYVHLDLLTTFPLWSAAAVAPAGNSASFSIPAGLAGQSLRMQLFVVSPLAANGYFAVSDPRDVRLE